MGIRWRYALWLLMLGCAIPTTQATELSSDKREQVEQTLDKKFEKGKYSRQGANTCLGCHDGESEHSAMGVLESVHGKTANLKGPINQNQCESCHGPLNNHHRKPRGDKPREPMITFDKHSPLPAEKKNSVCLSCHQDTHDKQWPSSAHATADVACVDCHTIHQKTDPMRDPITQTAICVGCHTQTKASLHKRSAHPMRNGDMSCSNCHNPHQSVNEFSLRHATINENCTSCHDEKRGPFLWEHEPVSEDCSSCHTPHGSINQALLNKRSPMLCQQCHSVPHANVDISASDLRARGGSCLNCHTQVHGSNHPRGRVLSH